MPRTLDARFGIWGQEIPDEVDVASSGVSSASSKWSSFDLALTVV